MYAIRSYYAALEENVPDILCSTFVDSCIPRGKTIKEGGSKYDFVSRITSYNVCYTKLLREAWKWYRKHFSMDIRMFEEEAVAELMLAHTDGQPRKRHAVLALNMQGGGGFEIWQHKGKKPEPCSFEIQVGDLGINIGKIKTADVQAAYQKFKSSGLNVLTSVQKDPVGNDRNNFV